MAIIPKFKDTLFAQPIMFVYRKKIHFMFSITVMLRNHDDDSEYSKEAGKSVVEIEMSRNKYLIDLVQRLQGWCNQRIGVEACWITFVCDNIWTDTLVNVLNVHPDSRMQITATDSDCTIAMDVVPDENFNYH